MAYTAGQQRTIDLIKPDIEALKVPPVLIGFGGSHSAPNDYDELIRKFAAKCRLEQTPHHTGMIAYTSGSTGLPKGAIYPHDKFLRTILYAALYEGLTHDMVWLQAMPAAGVPMMHLLRNIFGGGTCVMVGPGNAELALTLIAR